MSVADITVISRTYDAMLALIYPQACAVCGGAVESRHDGVICADCWAATRLFDEEDTLCWKCGALAPAKLTADRIKSVRCGRCDDDSFTAARACGMYEGALRACVVTLKREPHVARRLLQTLVEAQHRSPTDEAEVIVPVPLHIQRERERGHNQAAILARELSRMTALPIEEGVLFRRVHTERHRAGMDAKARRKSVAGAFEVRQPRLIADRRVLLIDDVFTTGATISECARVLIASGAAAVYVLTIARA
jgi:ComF family protein